jgi:hypothetical protein
MISLLSLSPLGSKLLKEGGWTRYFWVQNNNETEDALTFYNTDFDNRN